MQNAGFVIHYSPVDESTRYSTYSLRNKAPAEVEVATTFNAFKVLPSEFGQHEDESDKADSCEIVADRIVRVIQRQCDVPVEDKDVVG